MTDSRRLQVRGSAGELALIGSIDESSDLLELLTRAKDKRLALDLGGVTFINSLGVRDWIRMMAAATDQGIEVDLRRVAEVLMHQLNMIVATRGTARVTSFFAPYACDACGREDSLLIDVAATCAQLRTLQAPQLPCPECGAVMGFNDFPERYFSFLTPT